MRARQLPGAALLGLLVALLAHSASYGHDHVAGGAYHATLELLALVGVGAFVLVAAALALSGARRHADGSILAAGLRPLVPQTWSMAATGALWFGTIEALEPGHVWHAPLPLVAIYLVAAAAFMAFLARVLVDALARIAFAIAGRPFARRPLHERRRFSPPSSARRVAFAYRRCARPPPVLMLLPA